MILRSFLLLSLLFTASGPLLRAAQASSNENQFGASINLFTTMAAINAAGYDSGMDSTANYPIRQQIRDEIAKRHPAIVA